MGDFEQTKAAAIAASLAACGWRVRHRAFGIEACGKYARKEATALYASDARETDTSMLLAFAQKIRPLPHVRLLFDLCEADDDAYAQSIVGVTRAYAVGYDATLDGGVYASDGVVAAARVTAHISFASHAREATEMLRASTDASGDKVRTEWTETSDGARWSVAAFDIDRIEDAVMRLSHRLVETDNAFASSHRLVVIQSLPPLRCSPSAVAVLRGAGAEEVAPSFAAQPFARIAARVPSGMAWVGGEDKDEATEQAVRIYAAAAGYRDIRGGFSG